RRVGRERLEPRETSLARGQERDPDPFGGHLLDPLHLQTEGVPVERQRVVQRSDGDAEMVDDHDGPPSFSISLSTAVYGSIVLSANAATHVSKTPPVDGPSAHSSTR